MELYKLELMSGQLMDAARFRTIAQTGVQVERAGPSFSPGEWGDGQSGLLKAADR